MSQVPAQIPLTGARRSGWLAAATPTHTPFVLGLQVHTTMPGIPWMSYWLVAALTDFVYVNWVLILYPIWS